MTRKPYRPNFIYRWNERAERPMIEAFKGRLSPIRWYEWAIVVGAVIGILWCSARWENRPVPITVLDDCKLAVAQGKNRNLGECLAIARSNRLY